MDIFVCEGLGGCAVDESGHVLSHRLPANLWIKIGRSGTVRPYINPTEQSSCHEIRKAPDRSGAFPGVEVRPLSTAR
jgi:hypothetical protein